MHLIPATELTAYDYERAHRVHLLCYWPDDCPALEDFSRMMAERRYTAMMQSSKELEEICPQYSTPGGAGICQGQRHLVRLAATDLVVDSYFSKAANASIYAFSISL